ncbi:major facilitator superfamily domain-containing protein [Russula earlei]|uniref:Major facilitator superfamily domain-containing protein n=1 Tax=Russula earlei TaxID=71964 RepID=A0ACC0UAM9_9AGAM|nr:major facilitator superfamily domain-containing protein [Russula earlei]
MTPMSPNDEEEHEPLLVSTDPNSQFRISPPHDLVEESRSHMAGKSLFLFSPTNLASSRIGPVIFVSSLCIPESKLAQLGFKHARHLSPPLLDQTNASAAVKTTESILSAVTTGWLSHMSDMFGRKQILLLSMFGALFMDFIYILVSDPSTLFGRYGETFIVIAPLVEGILGAQSTYNGIVHAYITDCTPDGSRAKIFSTMQAMLNIGMASGPWLNGIVLHAIAGTTTISLFVLAIAIAVTNFAFVLFILPESLARSRRLSHVRSPVDQNLQQQPKGVVRRIGKTLRNMSLQFLRPAALFVPSKLEGRRGRDWNLTLTGVVLFLYMFADQAYNLKYLYVKHVYSWSTEQLGYYMSFLWVIRAVNLLIILPLILAYFDPKGGVPMKNATPTYIASAIRFDRRVAAVSLFMDASANVLIAISPTASQALFVFLTSLNALTSGGHPAIQSLGAVSLRAMGKGNEMGLVFGALGLLNAASHIVAPGTYAAIYGATVATFPKAMFIVSAALLYIAVSLLSRVRPDIHVPTLEPENTFLPRASEYEYMGGTGEGSNTDVRNRSRDRESEHEHDALLTTSMISLATQSDLRAESGIH